VLFQVSDLAGGRRREFLDLAKRSTASLRDTDGCVLTMLPQHEVSYLRELADVAVALITAEAALARSPVPKPSELGSFAWLAEFDSDDRAIALGELRDALALAHSVHDTAPLHEVVRAWATTARVMRDPLRRAVFTASGGFGDDYIEVDEPT